PAAVLFISAIRLSGKVSPAICRRIHLLRPRVIARPVCPGLIIIKTALKLYPAPTRWPNSRVSPRYRKQKGIAHSLGEEGMARSPGPTSISSPLGGEKTRVARAMAELDQVLS